METLLSYRFNDASLLDRALTHPSYAAQHKGCANYERLEFLGDAVLNLIVAEYLWKNYPDESEGSLARRQAALICGKTLSSIATKIKLANHLKMSEGEISSGGKENQGNLENALEAVVGALFIDGGLKISQQFVLKHIAPLADEMTTPPKDAKTTLQEWAQSKSKPIPEYKTIHTDGPAHAPLFTVSVSVEGESPTQGKGASKRAAEQQAAKQLLNQLSANIS